MKLLRSLALVFPVLVFSAGVALAQTPLVVSGAELAQGFGAAKGQIALVGNQILFVATDDPKASLAIDRADIAKVDRSGDVVTVTTRRSLGDRDEFRFRLAQPADLVRWYDGAAVASTAPARPAQSGVLASYQAKHDHRLGSCRGTLVLTNERVAFESIDEINDSRQWQLVDIKEVKQDGVYKLEVKPFLGDTFNFELTGKGMDSGEYRRLVDRIARARATF
ncbi:MAG: hypothetical protein KA371_09895 [Acidobacteria bacterium]|nr:hypothetical protein [Acidobacteriota bacterium]